MPPKVLHLVISLAPGGLERLVVDWANERNRRNPASTLIGCLDEPGDLAVQVEGRVVANVHAARSRRPFDLGAVRRLKNVLRGNSISVLHSHNVAAWQYGVLACLGTRIKHIHTEHGTNPHYGGLVNRLRNAWLWRLTDVVVVVADKVAEQVESRQGIPKARLRVIPNGVMMAPEVRNATIVSRPAASSALKETLGIPSRAIVIGSVGRLAHVKGYDRLMGALKKVVGYQLSVATPSLCLLLVGDGPERPGLEKLAHDLGVADKVIFAGYQANPAPYLRAMDLFVLSSRSEGLSISLLEAMAAGIPAAVTDVGECRRVVDDGRAGVVLPEDEGSWPDVLMSILQDPAAAQDRADVARIRVREHYSLKATLDAYEALYGVG